MTRALLCSLIVLALVTPFLVAGCGGSDKSPAAPAVPAPTATPAPAPTPTPQPQGTPDPRIGLAAGPVVRYTIKVRTIDTGNFRYRDPFEDEQGRWIVHPGEFVVFDSTQKNAAGEICQWINNPTWIVNDPDRVFNVRGSSQPFLLRTDVMRRGTAQISARIDGIDSNILVIRSN